MIELFTETDVIGFDTEYLWAKQFEVIRYQDGGISLIPHNFFRNWLDEQATIGNLHIGKCSGIGTGSIAKYESPQQCLRIGRFFSGGQHLRFLLNGQHESRTISTYMFSITQAGLTNAPIPQYGDSIIKNDVWFGDEVMMLGGGIVETGCIIGARALLPPNFRSAPYGIYAGSPARLIRFRFSEKICESLLDLAWWEMPLDWILDNNNAFLQNMTTDEGHSLEILSELKKKKAEYQKGKV